MGNSKLQSRPPESIGKRLLIGLGLLIHMALDGLDCIWMLA